MTRIGAGWLKTKNDGSMYYSVSVDEEILPLTIDKGKMLILKENKNKGNNPKAPDMVLDIFIPKKTVGGTGYVNEEAPF